MFVRVRVILGILASAVSATCSHDACHCDIITESMDILGKNAFHHVSLAKTEPVHSSTETYLSGVYCLSRNAMSQFIQRTYLKR